MVQKKLQEKEEDQTSNNLIQILYYTTFDYNKTDNSPHGIYYRFFFYPHSI